MKTINYFQSVHHILPANRLRHFFCFRPHQLNATFCSLCMRFLINGIGDVNEEIQEYSVFLSKELLVSFQSKSRVALHYTKVAVRAAMATTFTEAIAKAEQIYLNDLMKTNDAQEGLKSFMDKRAPVWHHSQEGFYEGTEDRV